eukprot:3125608-Rhodomonas_salina.2
MLCRAAILWVSNRQAVVALSSSEAEFYAVSASGCNVSYFRNILAQLRLEQKQPTIVFEDKWACIHLSLNAVLHHKSKHINVRVDHLRDLCKRGIMSLLKIGTESMVADTLTKPLPKPAFEAHRFCDRVTVNSTKQNRCITPYCIRRETHWRTEWNWAIIASPHQTRTRLSRIRTYPYCIRTETVLRRHSSDSCTTSRLSGLTAQKRIMIPTETEVNHTTQNQLWDWTVIESESLSVESITDRTAVPETLFCGCAGVILVVTSSQ